MTVVIARRGRGASSAGGRSSCAVLGCASVMDVRSGSMVLCVALTSAACARSSPPVQAPTPHVMLAQATPAAATSAQPAPQGEESPEQRRSRHHGRALGWISIGIGSAAGVVALGTSYYMLQDHSNRDSNCTNKVCS